MQAGVARILLLLAASGSAAGMLPAPLDHRAAGEEEGPAPRWILPSTSEWMDLDVGDVDGDGPPEVVAVTRAGLVQAVDARTGRPLWSARVGDLALGVRVADLDADGESEVVVAAFQRDVPIQDLAPGLPGQGIVQVLRGSDGEALGAYRGALARDTNLKGLAVLDLTGDAVADVAVAAARRLDGAFDGAIAVDGRALLSGEVERELWSVRTGDWTRERDGIAAATVPGLCRAVVFLASWDGHLRAIDGSSGAEIWRFSGALVGIPSMPSFDTVDLVDMEGDGVLEVMGVGRGHGLFVLDAATGAERWNHTPGYEYPAPGFTLTGTDAAALDFTGDGTLDVVMAGHVPGREGTKELRVWGVDGTTRRSAWSLSLGVTEWLPWRILARDLDGDGAHEILFSNGDAASLDPVLPGGDDRSVLHVVDPRAGRIVASRAFPARAEAFDARDADGDRRADVFVGDFAGLLYGLAPELPLRPALPIASRAEAAPSACALPGPTGPSEGVGGPVSVSAGPLLRGWMALLVGVVAVAGVLTLLLIRRE